MKARAAIISILAFAAGISLAAFTLDTFRNLQTSVAASTANICTNVNVDVTSLDTVSLQFRGRVLTNAGDGTVSIAFQRGYDSNTLDKATFATWTFSTVGWAAGTTNYASTNLFSIRDFRTLVAYSITNGNTSALSAVQLSFGSH